MADKHHDANAFERAAALAWTQAQVQLRYLGSGSRRGKPVSATRRSRSLPQSVHAPAVRHHRARRRRSGGAVGAWDFRRIPIVLVRIDDIEEIAIVGQLLRAHEYWRMKQLAVDLVILNERASSYIQDFKLLLRRWCAQASQVAGSARTQRAAACSLCAPTSYQQETRALLPAVARVVLTARRGSLSEQLDRSAQSEHQCAAAAKTVQRPDVAARFPRMPDLDFFNGLGGFAADGREYVTILKAGQATPAPWINVIANESFGFQVAAEGGGYTWAGNSRENQLTPWSNDPVTDRPGEVIYLRDEDTGELWCPTAQPIRSETAPYIVRHGQGYSRFEHTAHGIATRISPVRPAARSNQDFAAEIRNNSPRTRRLSVTAYVEWVLGPSRTAAAPFIVTEVEPETGALFARNPWNPTFGSRVAFADMGGRQRPGRATGASSWAAMERSIDPAALCAARRGAVRTGGRRARSLRCSADGHWNLSRARRPRSFSSWAKPSTCGRCAIPDRELPRSRSRRGVSRGVAVLGRLLGTVQVKTPDRAMDLMLNRWLLYQTVVCRLWARRHFIRPAAPMAFATSSRMEWR